MGQIRSDGRDRLLRAGPSYRQDLAHPPQDISQQSWLKGTAGPRLTLTLRSSACIHRGEGRNQPIR